MSLPRARCLRRMLVALLLVGSACGGGTGDPQPAPGPGPEQQLAAEIANAFPFTPNQPFDGIYLAGRQGSTLAGYFELRADSTLEVSITTDTHDHYAFTGTWTFSGGAIRILVPPNGPVRMTGPPMGPLFPAGLDETSTIVMSQFGLVAAFATPTMVFVLIGHGANAFDPVLVSYLCPAMNDQPESYEENAIEFGMVNRPFGEPIPGSVFRQRDLILENDPFNPRITRAYGIYRTVGDTFYASFRIAADFALFAGGAGVALPITLSTIPPFPDRNLLEGAFLGGGAQVSADHIAASGPCDRQ